MLVIGDCGSGKTALVNNLLGEDIAEDQNPSTLSMFKGEFQGVPVTVYETSGLKNAGSAEGTENKNRMRSLLRERGVDVIIYCFKATETRMRESLIHSLQDYHTMGLDWRKTVIAMTFADVLPIPKSARNEPSYDQAKYFNSRVAEWKQMISQTLTTRIRVPVEMVEGLKLAPATGDIEDALPNHEQWYGTMWSLVLDAIKAAPSSSYILPDQPRPAMKHSAAQPTSYRAGTKSSGSQPSRYQGPKPSPRKEGHGSRDGLLTPSPQREDQSCSAECICACFGSCLRACSKLFSDIHQACRRACDH